MRDIGDSFALQVGNELLEALLVARSGCVLLAELSLPLGRLLGQDVAPVALGVAELAARGALETLRGTPVRLHLRHGLPFLPGPPAPRLPVRRPPRRAARLRRPPDSVPTPSRGSVRSSGAGLRPSRAGRGASSRGRASRSRSCGGPSRARGTSP